MTAKIATTIRAATDSSSRDPAKSGGCINRAPFVYYRRLASLVEANGSTLQKVIKSRIHTKLIHLLFVYCQRKLVHTDRILRKPEFAGNFVSTSQQSMPIIYAAFGQIDIYRCMNNMANNYYPSLPHSLLNLYYVYNMALHAHHNITGTARKRGVWGRRKKNRQLN